ncbi:MAG: class I mannose-6-phosphate isomerase, partial [Clostridia bacterium]|nr:class I mannose-6-phosphate isomerase [Clostridia bacterium]
MLYPIRLRGIVQTAIWGGSLLRDRYGKEGVPGMPAAESWELTVRPGCANVIENGACAGMTIDEYLTRVPAAMGRDAGKRFPLLAKLIDAARPLSVQVHPDDAYAAANEKDGGKTEMWYIMDADPGARMVLGMQDGVTTADFAAALAAGDPLSCLRTVEVKAGETYFVPAGYLHAIGVPGYGEGGILVAEIQQNSNLTYRVWDYNRPGADGKPRALHTDRALDVIRPFRP